MHALFVRFLRCSIAALIIINNISAGANKDVIAFKNCSTKYYQRRSLMTISIYLNTNKLLYQGEI